MRWRIIVLAALAIGFGMTAGVFIAVDIRLDAAVGAIQADGDSGLTAAQSASLTAMISQGTALGLFTGPLVAGSLLCVVGLLVVLARRWQTQGGGAQN